MGKQNDRQLAARVRRVDELERLGIADALEPADMGPEGAVVEQRDSLRRNKAAARVGRMRIRHRKEIGEHRAEIEQRHNDEADHGQPVPPEPPPRQLQLSLLRQPVVSEANRGHARPCRRMRGSIHIKSRSDISVPITVSTPSSSTIVPARNMSCATSACSNSGPTVGRPSTRETTMLPETR